MSVVLAAFTLVAACARSETDTSDTAAGAADAGMTGMDRSSAAANRGPSTDADHEFLRMMSDHHEGLIEMASAAMNKGSTAQIQGDAHQLHTKQEQEQKEMVDMVRNAYGENLEPAIMPSNRAMNDTLQQKSGVEYDRTFYRMVVQHHREGIRMMDQFRPRVQRAEVRQMLDRMRSEQQREIQELEAKIARVN
ncbi:MAG TPA: DUF305 domain-containing protein [Dehalococcoidia bacterium]|nr:DUF305 domain-containing protein [Dehalococcoidia bacterium]